MQMERNTIDKNKPLEEICKQNINEGAGCSTSQDESKTKSSGDDNMFNRFFQWLTKTSDQPVEEMDKDIVCGIGSFKPRWLQTWATPKTYLVVFSFAGILQSSYYAHLVSSLNTLEKRFAFKSKVSGAFMMVDEITPLFLAVIIAHFGSKAHRPRVVAIGMVFAALSCFLAALPFFLYGSSQNLVSADNLNTTANEEYCDFQFKEKCEAEDRPPTMPAVICLLLASFFKGFGNVALFTLGFPYLDDSAKKKNTSLYFAVSMALHMMGPIGGYVLSSVFLQIYENPFVDPGFGPEDPRWIGAWWLGFTVQGFLLLIFAFPMALFPRRAPAQRQKGEKRSFRKKEEERRAYGKKGTEQTTGLFKALKRLAKNPIFICYVTGSVFSINGGFGYYMMIFKYMENQFRLSASQASLYSGPPGVTACRLMAITGAIVIWKYKPKARTIALGMCICEAIMCMGYFILMIPGCKQIHLGGSNLTEKGLVLENNCNSDCMCTRSIFNPACGPDGITTYFSPCFAGCSEMGHNNGTEVFQNCSCVRDVHGNFLNSGTVQKGYCKDEECWLQSVTYIIIYPIILLFFCACEVGSTIIFLRSMDSDDRSVALGVYNTLLGMLCYIPYPVVFGSLVDSACLIWEESCDQTGNCWFYDVTKLNYILHGSAASFSISAVCCNIVLFWHAGRLKNLYEEDEIARAEPSFRRKSIRAEM